MKQKIKCLICKISESINTQNDINDFMANHDHSNNSNLSLNQKYFKTYIRLIPKQSSKIIRFDLTK
jgi:hypothetical protein